jgi:hypothetical protein
MFDLLRKYFGISSFSNAQDKVPNIERVSLRPPLLLLPFFPCACSFLFPLLDLFVFDGQVQGLGVLSGSLAMLASFSTAKTFASQV